MVGLSACIADLGKVKMTSVIGWLLWSVVHLFFLIGARSHHRLRELGLGLADLRPRARLVISIELQTRKEFGYLDGIAHCSPSCRSSDADLARDLLDLGAPAQPIVGSRDGARITRRAVPDDRDPPRPT